MAMTGHDIPNFQQQPPGCQVDNLPKGSLLYTMHTYVVCNILRFVCFVQFGSVVTSMVDRELVSHKLPRFSRQPHSENVPSRRKRVWFVYRHKYQPWPFCLWVMGQFAKKDGPWIQRVTVNKAAVQWGQFTTGYSTRHLYFCKTNGLTKLQIDRVSEVCTTFVRTRPA